MADIFISYKKEDAGRVVRIVEGLREEGFTVWWDHGIAPGSSWDQTIQKELEAAKLVIAVWSELSVSAPWVKEEAQFGKQRGKLLPVRIDDVEPPLGFGLIQMADLSHWDGDIEDATWDHFIEAAKATIEGKPVHGLEKPVKRKNPILKLLPIAALVTLVAGAGAYALYALSSVESISVENSDGTSSAYSRSGPAKPTEAENAMFAKAQDTTLRDDYLEYLRIYPNGAYADKIRDQILPFCESEQRDYWKEMSTNVEGNEGGQRMRGVSTGQSTSVGSDDLVFATRESACESAKKDVQRTADVTCRSFVRNNKSRNPEYTLTWPDDCDCKYLEAGETWLCSVDPQFVCDWEALTFEYIQVCKG